MPTSLAGVRRPRPPLASSDWPEKPDLYAGASTLTGPLVDTDRVRYRGVMSKRQRIGLGVIIAVNVMTAVGFLGWLLWPSRLPALGADVSTIAWITGLLAVTMVVGVEVVRAVQITALWAFATQAKDPVPMTPEPGTRVAVLTTIVPSKEPVDLVVRTLRAMKKLEHDGPVDVWILDEGDDPEVRRAAAAIGVKHFSRKGVARWNTESGQFKAKTKAGNHNAWRDAHEHEYDVVAQMDPDHVPAPDFLTRTLGYFRDPDVGFVVAPQVYGNIRENWIAKGAAEQAYIFHGVMQRGGNGMNAPLLIGTNHLYRPTAWRQIGGYQDSIIEDHLTAMTLYSATNPATGRKWKGVYTPDIIAIGEGPTSYTDYFNQQKRWAYGIWEIMGKKNHRILTHVSRRQRLSFSLLQLFYPSVAIGWLLGTGATGLYLLGGAAAQIPAAQWFTLWGLALTTSLATFSWLRRFNLIEHERRDSGLTGMGLFLTVIPVYTAAAISFVLGRPLAYAVTAKGNLTSPDRLRTFSSHLLWIAGGVILLGYGFAFGTLRVHPHLGIWAAVASSIAAVPVIVYTITELRSRQQREHTEPTDSVTDSPWHVEVIRPPAVATRSLASASATGPRRGTLAAPRRSSVVTDGQYAVAEV